MTTVAVFDVDRTLIAGSSAPVYAQALNSLGINTPSVPGQSIYFKLYERFGEDPITLRLARHIARVFEGHTVATAEAAGRLGADVLKGDLLTGAHEAIEQHRSQGDRLVMATTATYDLIRPLADALGFDDLIATHYRSVDGVYDGTIEGNYVWAEQKADELARWAGAHRVDLTKSSAYSDSWYDVPLLGLVGSPVAVNPDMRLRAHASRRDWEIREWATS